MPEQRKPVGKKAKRPLTPKQGGAPASADTPPSTPKRGAATVPDDLGPRLASITIDDCNPLVRKAEYAVRGRLLTRSKELEAELKAGATLPFQQIVRCNIGNPQALGQPPLSYVRQTLALLMDRSLIDSPEVAALYKPDILDRARAYSGAVASVGAYSDSQGIALVRQHVSDFIAARDGFPASADDIFLTDGASSGVKMWMQLLVRGPQDAVLAPIPQYPLYSAVTTMLDGTLAGYYLDESADWGVNEAELRRALERAREQGAVPRAMVVINPGNPTGQSLPKATIESILAFAASERLVLMADEVYQENVYGDAPPFNSFKRALSELRAKGATDADAAAMAERIQLVSFHSTSKGFIGECGLRGGYFELQGFDAGIKSQLTKLASVCLCSNVIGQITTGLMVSPPQPGDASHEVYAAERAAILDSLARRAQQIAAALNELPGISCNAAQGAMYLFPQLSLPAKAVAAAAEKGMPADEFYCLRLIDATGLVVVPGSGFGQVEGTFHFRTTFLPPEGMLTNVLVTISDFHRAFMQEFE